MASSDPYLDRSAGVLRNRLGLTDRDELRQAEADFVDSRLLGWNGLTNKTFDASHLSAIHRHLFQDVYEWAGLFRTVGIGKAGPDGFWPSDTLAARATKIFDRLRAGLLMSATVDDATFLREIASLYLDINQLHPFREGNGRTQRVFLNDVAAISNRVIDWRLISRDQNDEACAATLATQSSAALEQLLSAAIVREDDRSERLSIAELEMKRSGHLLPAKDTTPLIVRVGLSGTCGLPTKQGTPCKNSLSCRHHRRA